MLSQRRNIVSKKGENFMSERFKSLSAVMEGNKNLAKLQKWL